MNKLVSIVLILFSFALLGNIQAAENTNVVINDPYVRAVPPGQTVSAAFMVFENKSDKALAVINAHSEIADVVELHTHTHKDGMMQMRRIEKIDLPAQAKTTLKPGGLHIMLIDLKQDIKPGQMINITLDLSDGSQKAIQAPVRKIMMQDMKHHGMKH
jgi:copper(I)-binding protein